MVFSKLMLSSLVGSILEAQTAEGAKKISTADFQAAILHRERCLSPSRGTDINFVMEEGIDFTVS